jgi:hypothetical protein
MGRRGRLSDGFVQAQLRAVSGFPAAFLGFFALGDRQPRLGPSEGSALDNGSIRVMLEHPLAGLDGAPAGVANEKETGLFRGAARGKTSLHRLVVHLAQGERDGPPGMQAAILLRGPYVDNQAGIARFDAAPKFGNADAVNLGHLPGVTG